MSEPNASVNAVVVASRLAEQLESRGTEYAFGGAIALGYWGEPRGTLDVDLTIFLPPERPSDCVWLLQDMGCDVSAAEALQSLRDHGFCSVKFAGMRVDVFLPTIAFYETARVRRKRLELGGQPIMAWDAETLAVFKMMFFAARTWPTWSRFSARRGRNSTGSGCGTNSPECMEPATRASPPGTN